MCVCVCVCVCVYVRYIDVILILADNIEEIKKLQEIFQNNSVCKFTYELNNKIPFLDELIDTNNNNFYTSTYNKNIFVIIHVV